MGRAPVCFSPFAPTVTGLCFEDFDALSEAISGWDLEFRRLARRPFRGELLQVEAGPVLLRSLNWIFTLRISPDGKVIAFTQGKFPGDIKEIAHIYPSLYP